MSVCFCRQCDNQVEQLDKVCKYCKTTSPGIESYCPSCRSEDYVFHKYGFAKGRSLAGAILAGPVGLAAGYIGYGDIECICKSCKQGWLPFSSSGVSPTRKFSEIPADCYN
jgi:RNA polymerase subunit RPABC4/transcription elongation factor Spt4